MNPATENNMMVARLLCVDEAEAAELLSARVCVTFAAGGTCEELARELKDQLKRTVVVTDECATADVEVVIGLPASGKAKKDIYVSFDQDGVTIDDEAPIEMGPYPALHGLQIVIAACYAAGYALSRAIPGLPKHEGAFKLSFTAIGATTDFLETTIAIQDTALAGAGAVGNGFLRALKHLNVHGEMWIADPKQIGAGNANRCLYFEPGETGAKAEVLCTKAQPSFPSLTLKPFVGRFDALRKNEGRLKTAIVATDSRPARRTIQNELPLEVVDASTTDVSEVIVHSHRQPTDGACLACVYKHVVDEEARTRDIASGLGVGVSDVDPAGLVDDRVAGLIVAAHPSLKAGDIVGKAFDTLFKQLCGQQALLAPGGQQVLAPFAFVSNLAGAYLALELARLANGSFRTNYMYLDPWHQPHSRLRKFRGKEADCSFCADADTLEALKAVWPEASFT